jgi:hypothetical protein
MVSQACTAGVKCVDELSRMTCRSPPRDVWHVHLGVKLENVQRRLRKNSFRTFVPG